MNQVNEGLIPAGFRPLMGKSSGGNKKRPAMPMKMPKMSPGNKRSGSRRGK